MSLEDVMPKPAKPKAQAAKQTAPKKTGRPSKYTPEIAREIVERLSEGTPLWEICRDEHMPHWRTIYDWMYKDDRETAAGRGVGLSASIARAREIGQDAIAEDCIRIIDQEPSKIVGDGGVRYDSAYVQWQKNRVEQRLKLLAKWNPKRYGDRVTMAGDAENPLQVQADISIFDAMLKNLETKRQLGDK
jgi:hypothetical protein